MFDKLHRWHMSLLGHALLGAVLLWAALPPLGLAPLALVAPAWWVLLIRRERLDGRRPYLTLWMVGFGFWLAVLHWLRLPHPATSIGWVALSFYFAFYLPVFVGLSRVAVHQLRVPVILAAPVVWTGLELARGHLLTGMTMASLGHALYQWTALIQLSDLAGAYGVSFVVMLLAASFARMAPCDGKPWAVWPLLPGAAVLGAALLYGHLRMQGDFAGEPTCVALIQGCIDTELKSDPGKRAYVHTHYRELTDEAVVLARTEGKSLGLIVWPETMLRDTRVTFAADAWQSDQYESMSREHFLYALEEAARESTREMRGMARHYGVPMILGVDEHHFGPDRERFFNTAVLVDSEGEIRGRYAKMHRVLFGEYTPFAEWFPVLKRLTPVAGSLSAGREPAAFEIDGLRISPNICYESVMPHVLRRQVLALRRQGFEPDVLVNLTNDGWFWGSSELDLHLICGVFRAVECRKPLLIAANTGFSAWIDGDGQIVQRGPRRATGVLLAEVCPDARRSFYLAWGDWPAGLCLAATGLFAAVGLMRLMGKTL